MSGPELLHAPKRPRNPTNRDHSFASVTLAAHLRRGALGFVPLAVAAFVWPRFGWIAMAPAAVGLVMLRGCPMCWTIGLIQTVSRRRYRRDCTEAGCRLVGAGRDADRSAGTL